MQKINRLTFTKLGVGAAAGAVYGAAFVSTPVTAGARTGVTYYLAAQGNDGLEKTLKVRQIENEFLGRMFEEA